MCLIVKESPKIAKKDIVAYKVLEYKGGLIATPFQNMYIKLDRKYVNQALEKIDFCNNLSEGVYHLFSSFVDAEMFRAYAQKEYSNDFNCSTFKVVKAIIPKGTKYYIGESEIGSELDRMFQHESYGAKSVIYKELDA